MRLLLLFLLLTLSLTLSLSPSSVDGYMQKRAFISTQGPLPRTIPDFWSMVWMEKSVVIVMTTRTVERCRQKCGQYWPLEEQSEEEYGDFRVRNLGLEVCPDYVMTRLSVTYAKVGELTLTSHD